MDALYSQTEAAMLAMRSADNALIGQATTYVKSFMNKKAAAATLFALLQNSPHTIVRQLSGVLLRRKAISFWNKLTPPLREELKSVLVQRLAVEPERSVRKTIIVVIAALGKALVPGGNWPELITAMSACAAHPEEHIRETGLVLLLELELNLGAAMMEFIGTIKPQIGAGLVDPAQRVRAVALRCLGVLLSSVDDPHQLPALQDMLPAMVSVTQQCLDARIDDVVSQSLDSFHQLLEMDSAVVHPYIEQLAHFLLHALANEGLEPGTRDLAGQCLIALVQQKPKTFANKKLVDVILPVLYALMAQYDPEEERELIREAREAGVEAVDHVDSSIWNVAGRVLDAIGVYVSVKHVFPRVSAFALSHLNDPVPANRQAAVTMLAICSEGCVELYSAHLEDILPVLLTLETDPEPMVREALLWCLAQLSEFVNPRILHFHATMLPATFRMLADKSPWVTERGCEVLECFVDGLAPSVLALYLDSLMAVLGELLVRPDQAVYVRETVVAALASVASAAGSLLLPYFAPLMTSLGAMLQLSDIKELRLRAQATECVGHVAVAVGPAQFRPYLASAMGSVGEGLAFDYMELTENSFVFFECMAECFKEEFGSYLETLVPLLRSNIESTDYLQSRGRGDSDGLDDVLGHLENDEEEEEEEEGEGAGAGRAAGAGDEDDEDEDSGEDFVQPNGRLNLRVHVSSMEMKAAAVLCLGFLARHCPHAFAPYLVDATKLLIGLVGHFHDSMRQRSLTALGNMVACLLIVSPPVPGASPDAPPRLPDASRTLFDEIMNTLVTVLRDERDMRTVSSACVCIQECCKLFGLGAVVTHHMLLMKELLKIAREKAVCQIVNDDGNGYVPSYEDAPEGHHEREDEGHDEDAEHDHLLIDEATDAIIAIGRAMGSAFSLHLPAVMKAFARYSRASRPPVDQLMAIGLYGDLAAALGAVMNPYVPTVVQLILKAAGAKSAELRRNSLFTIGVLIEHCPDACAPFAPSMLAALQPAFTASRGVSEEDPVLDNAAAALCRIIMAMPALVPLGVALPPLLHILPIRYDVAEHKTVYTALLYILRNGPVDIVGANMPALAQQFAGAFAPSLTLPDGLLDTLIAPGLRGFMATADASLRAAFLAALDAMPAADTAALRASVLV